MKVILITLQTQQPILATSFQGDPNSDVSYSYIPGSMIRGALISRYIKYKHLSDLDLTNLEVRRLFFDQQTAYLNAYLVDENQERTLPTPRCLFKDKNEETEFSIYNFSLIERDKRDEEITPKSLGYDFYCIQDEIKRIKLYTTKQRINIHNFRDREKGRSHKKEGEIFRYQAIDSEQTFQTVILCQDQDLELLNNLLKKTDIWLGGSQSAGYGHCQIIDFPKVSNHEEWTEIRISVDERTDHETFIITLLSDAIFRDQWGQYVADPNLVKEAIEAKLNHQLEFADDGIYSSSTLIGGFNRKWGLPLPQIQAISAGSVFVFKSITLTGEQIQELELQGIGERCNEGFGRIAINWLSEEKKLSSEVLGDSQIKKSDTNDTTLSDSSSVLASKMLERMVRTKLDKEIQKKVQEFKIKNLESISNSQLSRLSLVARRGLNTISFDPVKQFLSEEHLTKNALRQFKTTIVQLESISLYDKLQEWIKNPKSWMTNPQDIEITLSRSIKGEITEELEIEYTLRLIIAIAKTAIKAIKAIKEEN